MTSSSVGFNKLHQAISDYARLRLSDESTYERIVEYFVHFIETHKKVDNALEQEMSNILAALEIA